MQTHPQPAADTSGRRILDGLAGIGCVNVGYGNERLVEAAARAMRQTSYAPSFFNTSNREAIRLAERLVEMTPGNLSHVFFQSSGSEANETAVRLALRYFELTGRPEKRLIIARQNAYHGSTMLTASLSGIPPMHFAGGALPLPGIAHIGAPDRYRHDPSADPDAFGLRAAGWLEDKILELGAENVAAFFAEPVQGAGGAIIPPDTYWAEIQRICKKYDVLLAVDEVVTGFGRTGRMFGAQTYGIAAPDLMQFAKGITSAYVPLGATMISGRLFEALAQGGEWYHGFTHSGHPVSCAVALANLDVLEEERIVERAREGAIPRFAERTAALADHPLVGEARSVGLLAGFQLASDKASHEPYDDEAGAGDVVAALALEEGLAFRAIGSVMALLPPLIITPQEVDVMFDMATRALDRAHDTLGNG